MNMFDDTIEYMLTTLTEETTTQGSYAADAEDNICFPLSPRAVKWDPIGYMAKVLGVEHHTVQRVLTSLWGNTCVETAVRTHDEKGLPASKTYFRLMLEGKEGKTG